MSKKSLLFLLLTALFAPWAAYAQQNSLTLYEDATETKTAIPMFVTWFDYFTRSQTVFPAEDLAEMAGGTITAIKFYTTNSNIPYTTVSAADIYLTEVEDATISSFIDKSLATVVCQGYFDFVAADGGGEVTLTFDTPYPYQGGNLLFGCDNIENNGYGIVYFYGKTATGASISGYNADAGGIINPTNCNFLPKTTFTYEPPVGESCQRPTSMAVSNIFSNSASVTWEGEGSIWNLRYKASYDANWTYVNGLTAKSYNLTDLYENTAYFVQVQNVCDNNSTSVWKAVSFRTLAISLTETFTTGEPPSGWARYRGLLSDVMNGAALTPNNTWSLGVWDFGNYDEVFDRHARLTISGSGCYYWLVSPTIAVENNVRLAFDLAVKHRTTGQNDNKVVVLVTTDGGTTWSILRQWDNQGSAYVYNSISTTGEAVYIDLSSYAGQSIRLAFYGESTVQDYYSIGPVSIPHSNTLHIDNVYVEHIPDCDRPMVFSVSTITGYNATLNWTSDADSWIVAYKTNADADFTEVPVTEHPYTLTDLVPGTVYSAKVRSVCGNLYSEWSNTVRFTTDVACPAPTNLSATNIIHNAATIRWTSYNENFQLRYRKQSDTDWIMVDNPTSPYRLTGLEPDTYYTVEVRANCGDDGESLWATRDLKTYACSGYIAYVTNISPTSVRAKLNGYSESFTVKYREAAIEDAPFKEDFEDDACLNDWTFISMNAANNIGNPNGAGRFSTAAHWGNYGFRFSSENAIQSGETYDQYLISPQLNTTGELKFYINCFLDTDFYVGYSTTTNDLEAFTWTEYRISYSQTWQIHRQQLPDDVKYVAFHYYYIPSITNQKFYIDDITIGTYEIEPAGPWNYVTTEETTIILDNLTGGTEYEAIVVPSCDETHESMTVSFTTPACEVGNVAVSNTTMTSATLNWTGNSDSYTVKCRTAAYFEGISGEDFGYEFPSGWTRYTGPLNADGTGPTTPVNSGWSYFPSWSYGTFTSIIHPNFRNWLVTRAITINPGYSLSFNVHITGEIPAWNPGNGGRFAVLISTDNKVHWTILREWNNTGSPYIWNNLVGPYQTINDINLNAYIGQTVHIAFYVNGLSEQWYGNDLYLSDVVCGRSIAAGAWQTVLSTGANTATIGNLYPDTKYDAVVVPSCDPTLASDIVSFSTVGCSVDEVEVSNITEQSATVNWNSYSDSYTVKYRKTPSVSYPYEMGFEDENAFANWTFISNNAANALGTTNGAGVHHTAAHGGLLGFRFSSYNTVEGGDYNAGDYIQYLISPLLNVSGNLRFYYRKSNRLYEELSVGYSTTTNNLNAFTWTEDIGALQEWQAMTLSLPANVKYIAFRYNGFNSYYAHIDDITIGECIVGNSEAWSTMNTSQATANLSNLTPGTEYEVKVSPSCDPSFESDVVYFTTKACSAPHFAEVSNISQHSVTVTWVGESESYNVKYRVVDGTGGWLSVSPVYTTTCTITNLYPGLDYEIVVVPLCDETLESNHVFFSTPPCTISEDLEISDITHHSATVSWTGCSESYTVQYREAAGVLFSEDFEDAESFAEWTFISMNEANAGWAGRGTEPAHHGSYGFRFAASLGIQSGETYDQYLISPQLNVTGELSFDYKKHNTLPHYLYVGYSTTTNDLEAFTWSENIGLTMTWQTYTQTLPADVKYVALHYFSNRYNYVYIDDIAISTDEPGDWNTITTDATTASLDNLNIGTPYDVVVVPSCNTSQVSNVVTFSTLSCAIPENVEVSNIAHTTATVSWIGQSASYSVRYRTAASAYYPFTEDFEGESVLGWTFLSNNLANDIGQPNGAGIFPDTVHSGSNSFRFSSWNDIPDEALAAGQTYDQCLISPQLTSASTLTFQYRKLEAINFIFDGDYLIVGYSTTTNDLTAFTLIDLPIYLPTSVNWQSSPEITLPTNVKYIAFFCHVETTSYVYLDDINIRVDVPASTWSQVAASTSPANLTNLAQGTTYEVKVVPSCGASSESDVVTFTTRSDDFKLFVTEGDWSNPNNWEPVGVPTINQDVELRANVTITGIAEANFITQGNHTITIEDGGQLKHSEYGINNALTVTIKKNITGYGEGDGNWYLIANPVINQITPSEENGLLNGPYDLYEWNDTVSDGLEWRNYKVDGQAFSLLSGSTGYLYANQDGTELSFYGPIRSSHNNRIVLIDNHDGSNEFGSWFLLGNPFVCDAYLIDPNYNTLACYRMNAEGTGFEAVEGAIAPFEGILYEAESSGYVYFTRTAPARSGTLNMTVTQGSNTVDNAIIRFGEGNTLGKRSLHENCSKIYIPQDGKDYAVVNAGQTGEIPVNFKAERNGTYRCISTPKRSVSAICTLLITSPAPMLTCSTPTPSLRAKTRNLLLLRTPSRPKSPTTPTASNWCFPAAGTQKAVID